MEWGEGWAECRGDGAVNWADQSHEEDGAQWQHCLQNPNPIPGPDWLSLVNLGLHQ